MSYINYANTKGKMNLIKPKLNLITFDELKDLQDALFSIINMCERLDIEYKTVMNYKNCLIISDYPIPFAFVLKNYYIPDFEINQVYAFNKIKGIGYLKMWIANIIEDWQEDERCKKAIDFIKENRNKQLIEEHKKLRFRHNFNILPKIKKVIFNNPATIVFWDDNTKTVVKCQKGDSYDQEKGLAMAISKKALGNKGNYYDIFKKWCKETVKEETIYYADDIVEVHIKMEENK